MPYKITITADAIEQSVAIKKAKSTVHDIFIDTIQGSWQIAVNMTKKARPILFTDEDNKEIGRGAMYAFDETLATQVKNGDVLTIPMVTKHLQDLGVSSPDLVIALFLQRYGAVPFSYGISIINVLLMEVGGSAIPAQANNEDGVEFDFTLDVINGNARLKGTKTFALIYDPLAPLGTFHYDIELTAKGELHAHPITLELNEDHPEAHSIFEKIRNTIESVSSKSIDLTIDKKIINQLEKKACPVRLAVKRPTKKRIPVKNIAKVLLMFAFMSVCATVAGLGIAAAVFGIITGSALLGMTATGLIAGGFAIAAVAATVALAAIAVGIVNMLKPQFAPQLDRKNKKMTMFTAVTKGKRTSTQCLFERLGQHKLSDKQSLADPMGVVNAHGTSFFTQELSPTVEKKSVAQHTPNAQAAG